MVDGECPEGTQIVDSMDCESAAKELGLTFVSKFEDKETRAGCVEIASGFAPGVYHNGHPEAPRTDDKEIHSSVCKRVRTTEEPTKMPVQEPDCDDMCMLENEVEKLGEDVAYLTEDLPTVLANQFQAMTDLRKTVEALQKEVDRLTMLVDGHDDKLSCLAGDN